jgi:hypothetical protein
MDFRQVEHAVGARVAYLDKACGSDTERRKRNEALLHEHDDVEWFG